MGIAFIGLGIMGGGLAAFIEKGEGVWRGR